MSGLIAKSGELFRLAGATFCLPLLISLTVGCSMRYDVPSGLEGPGDFLNQTPAGNEGSCRLLAVEEVELALNVKVAAAPVTVVRPILAGMQMCALISGRGTGGAPNESAWVEWGVLSKTAKEKFDNYKRVNSRYIEPAEVGGETAVWDGELRTFIAMHGVEAVGIRLTVNPSLLRRGVRASVYEKEAARLLLIRATDRLR